MRTKTKYLSDPLRVIPAAGTEIRWAAALCWLVAAASASPWTPVAAQAWPGKPIRVIVPFPPGGGLDLFARLTAQKLAEPGLLGQPLVIENRAGASGMIGADAVAKSAPDGYTVLFSTSAEITINQHLYTKMSYDPVNDLAPVSYAAHAALLLSVHPSVPADSLKSLIALARSKPRALQYATPGTGSVHHLTGELFKTAAGVDIVHIPYKGAGPAVAEMVSGQVSSGISAIPSSLPFVRAGKLRPIAITGGKRSEVAPEIPTFVELGFPAIDVVSWYGVLYPARTPATVIRRMSDEVKAAVSAPEVRSQLLKQGIEPVGTTPEQFSAFIAAEIARYGAIVKASGARLE